MSRALGDPARAIEPLSQRLDEKAERLALAWQSYFERRLGRLMEAGGKIRHPRDIVALASKSSPIWSIKWPAAGANCCFINGTGWRLSGLRWNIFRRSMYWGEDMH